MQTHFEWLMGLLALLPLKPALTSLCPPAGLSGLQALNVVAVPFPPCAAMYSASEHQQYAFMYMQFYSCLQMTPRLRVGCAPEQLCLCVQISSSSVPALQLPVGSSGYCPHCSATPFVP